MKAICIKNLFGNYNGTLICIEEGLTVDYTINNNKFIIDGVEIKSALFFNHFKIVDGNDKMNYSDFEYILCNYVFSNSVLFPNEYSGVRHLIIQGCYHDTIMITINKEENIIRVSFDDRQKKYLSYEEALDDIRAKK